MGTDKRIHSDLAIPPGEYLAEVLKAKSMSQTELASRIGRPIQAVNEIIKGEKSLTSATALQLERALSVPAHVWTGLESRYQLVKARNKEQAFIQKESKRLPNMPYKQLAEMGRVERGGNDEHKVRELHRFYGVSSLENLAKTRVYGTPFSRGPKRDASSYALAAWLRCAELQAAEVSTDAFSKTKLRAALSEIRALARSECADSPAELKRLLARCGVAVVLLPHFEKAFARGATFWPNPGKAVLLVGAEFHRQHDFWLSVFRGIYHLLFHRKTTFIDEGNAPPGMTPLEKEAHEFALRQLDFKATGTRRIPDGRGS